MTEPCRTALIVDDDELFRMGLALLLSEKLGFAQVVEAGSLDSAIDLLGTEDRIGFATFDLSMPGMQGPASLKAVREIRPDLRLVVLSGSRKRSDVLLALESGAHGFVLKADGLAQIERALKSVLDGTIYVPPLVADLEPGTLVGTTTPDIMVERLDHLTARQRDVLRLLHDGKSNKEISRALNLAEGTVKIHVAAILQALGVKSRHAITPPGAPMRRSARVSRGR